MKYQAVIAQRVTSSEQLKRAAMHYWRTRRQLPDLACDRAWLAFSNGETLDAAARIGLSSEPVGISLSV